MEGKITSMESDKLLESALKELEISPEELAKFSDYYNGDYSAYGNEVYKDVKVRLVHLENFLKGNWWNNRFFFLWNNFNKYDEVIDIGFSVPYLAIHLEDQGKLASLPKMIYVDDYESSKKLGEVILRLLKIKGDFVVGRGEDKSTWEDIKRIATGKRKLFVSFETIEHLERPELFWKGLAAFKGSNLALSLPIGPKIPSHNSVFLNEQEVRDYLSQYIDIKEEKIFKGESAYQIYTAIGSVK